MILWIRDLLKQLLRCLFFLVVKQEKLADETNQDALMTSSIPLHTDDLVSSLFLLKKNLDFLTNVY